VARGGSSKGSNDEAPPHPTVQIGTGSALAEAPGTFLSIGKYVFFYYIFVYIFNLGDFGRVGGME
jgi:hypothetical protein